MTDPNRWLDDAEASAHERVLLSSGRNMDPPPGAQEKVWASLQVHLGPVAGSEGNAATNGSSGTGSSGAGSSGAGSSGAGSSGASISTAIGGAKGVVAVIASVTAIAGAVAALVTASPTAPPQTDIPKSSMVEELPFVPNADIPEENPSLPDDLANDLAPESVVPSPSSSPIPVDTQPKQSSSPRVSNAKPSVVDEAPTEDVVRARQERPGRLREESRSLGDARAALRRGDAASALEKLDALGGQFPEGVLAQEREVLAIEALARAGQRTAASTRAAEFLQAHPTSPHATKVRGFLQ